MSIKTYFFCYGGVKILFFHLVYCLVYEDKTQNFTTAHLAILVADIYNQKHITIKKRPSFKQQF